MDSEDKKDDILLAEESDFIDSEDLEESNPRGVIIEILRNGQIAYISSGLEQVVGFKSTQILGTDIHQFIERFLGVSAAKQLWPLISEVLRGTRQFLESQVKGQHVVTEEEKIYLLQLEASSQNFNRAILFIQDQSAISIVPISDSQSRLNSMRILEKGNLFFLRSDLNLNVTEILGDTEKILGLKNFQLEEDPSLWLNLLSENQDSSLRKAFYRLIKKPRSFSKEISFKHHQSEEKKFVLFSATPIFDDLQQLVGWEGFGLDITDKKNYEIKLQAQTKRYNTLYNIISCVQSASDPKHIADLAVDSLMEATNSDAGGIWFGTGQDEAFDLLAIRGVPEPNYTNMWNYLKQPGNIVDQVCHNQYGIVLQDFAKEADDYSLQCLGGVFGSMLAVPLMINDLGQKSSIVGAFFLASKKAYHYQNDDLELLDTVAAQIAKITYSAEYLQAEKRQADSVNTLFLLSKSLTKSLTQLEIAQSSCSVIENLFSVKRIWFGVMNNSGSHIQGIYGKGPGMRTQLNEIQIELALRHDFLDQALSEKRPMLLDRGDQAECSGLNRFMELLKPHCVLIIPLVSIGQVVGLVAVEPNTNSRERMLAHLSLLTSISHEIASALLARKFELQIASSDKMKTVSLLASGVAHNFNNLLQAIMGQASILEAKLPDDSPYKRQITDIVDYAAKGAELVKQMSYLREVENLNSDVFDLCEVLQDQLTKYQDTYGATASIRLELDTKEATVFADRHKLNSVLENIIKNAVESIFNPAKNEVLIRISSRRLYSHEVSTELAPGMYYQIDIIDDGVGMDQEQLKHCFEPFYTTKNRDQESGIGYAASGLGLANSYNIMRSHGGIIIASSYVNKGSIFSVYLPHYNKELLSFKKQATSKVQSTGPVFVMIADSDSFDANINKLIELQNYRLLQLSNRGQMIAYLAKATFVANVLMIDLDQAGADIIDFFTILRDRFSNLKFLLLTSNRQQWESPLRFFENIYYLDKPINSMDFQKLLVNFSENSSNNTLIEQVAMARSEEED